MVGEQRSQSTVNLSLCTGHTYDYKCRHTDTCIAGSIIYLNCSPAWLNKILTKTGGWGSGTVSLVPGEIALRYSKAMGRMNRDVLSDDINITPKMA